jgi:hypothetical protein
MNIMQPTSISASFQRLVPAYPARAWGVAHAKMLCLIPPQGFRIESPGHLLSIRPWANAARSQVRLVLIRNRAPVKLSPAPGFHGFGRFVPCFRVSEGTVAKRVK